MSLTAPRAVAGPGAAAATAKTYEVRVVLVEGVEETMPLARVIAPDDDTVDVAALTAVDAAITGDADMRIALDIPGDGDGATIVTVEVVEVDGGEPVRWSVLAHRWGFAPRQPSRRQQPRPSAEAWKAWAALQRAAKERRQS